MKLDRVIAVRNSKTVFRDGEKCIKVFNHEYKKSEILHEAMNHAIAEEAGLPVPRIFEVSVIDHKWAIIYTYIRGNTLSHHMKSEPEKKDAYLETFTALQTAIHSISAPNLGSVKEQFTTVLERAPIREDLRASLIAGLSSLREKSTICHGDFDPSNIIMSEDGCTYILDWSRAACGDAAVDAAGTYLQFLLREETETAEQYLSLYCEKSGIRKEEILAWVPTAAAVRIERSNELIREKLCKLLASFDAATNTL